MKISFFCSITPLFTAAFNWYGIKNSVFKNVMTLDYHIFFNIKNKIKLQIFTRTRCSRCAWWTRVRRCWRPMVGTRSGAGAFWGPRCLPRQGQWRHNPCLTERGLNRLKKFLLFFKIWKQLQRSVLSLYPTLSLPFALSLFPWFVSHFCHTLPLHFFTGILLGPFPPLSRFSLTNNIKNRKLV